MEIISTTNPAITESTECVNIKIKAHALLINSKVGV